MKITNQFNLPDSIVNAITFNMRPPSSDRISVTDLISPPKIRRLKIEHYNELTEDASDRLWALLGKAVHYVLETGAQKESETETRLEAEMDGMRIVGISDMLHGTELSDYKITSVFSFLLGVKKEWENQLNVYAWLWRQRGKPIDSLKIYAILRDWQQSKALVDANYPRIAFHAVCVPLWPIDGQERYIRARLEAHKALNPLCSDEERWYRGEKWAVYKKGNKTAFKLFDNKEQAEALIKTDEKKYELQYRNGKYQRCESYCQVSEFCPQWQKEKKCTESV